MVNGRLRVSSYAFMCDKRSVNRLSALIMIVITTFVGDCHGFHA
jgi:hypothetical protein